MATKKAWYVFTYFGHLMTKQERLAYGHLVGTSKAMRGRTDASSQAEARKSASRGYRDLLSSDPEVLRLANEGLDQFVERVAHSRGLQKHDNVDSAGLTGTVLDKPGTAANFAG